MTLQENDFRTPVTANLKRQAKQVTSLLKKMNFENHSKDEVSIIHEMVGDVLTWQLFSVATEQPKEASK